MGRLGFDRNRSSADWPESDDALRDRRNKRLPKELRVADIAPDSTAAKFTPEDWSRMAEALGLPEHQQLFQVVKGLVAALPDKTIERALDISHGTMRRYMDRLFEHFQTHCRGEIAMKAVEAMNRYAGGRD